MKLHNLIQGSEAWIQYRSAHFNASDAPAMMGVSPYKTRAELLREMYTGVAPDIDPATRKRFDNGHRLEALARPLAEQILGEDLYPVVGSEGRLSASFDGLTMDEAVVFEHKALCKGLVDAFRRMGAEPSPDAVIEHLPAHYRVQLEQQLMVSGAQRALFMATNFDAAGTLIEARHCVYFPDAEMRAAILRGWEQFDADLAAYVLPDAAPAAPVGKTPETLPALRIEVTGQVTASNLAEFKATALTTIRSVNRTLATDQDFADAEKAVKWCADVEARLKAAKEHALSQTTSIDALFKALDDIGAEARTVRLDLDKLVARRKTEVKEEAVTRARRALDEHIARLNAEIAPFRLPTIAADFAGAIKGLKSVASMQDKLDGLLATAKISGEADARAIRANVATFKAEAEGFEFLFADLGQVIHKAAGDFLALVQGRIAQHKVAEAERERKRAEAEAQRVAAQQAEDARVAALAEQRRQDAAAESARIAAAAASAPAAAPHAAPVQTAAPWAFDPSNAQPAAPRADEPATLKLGVICERLGITMTAAFLADTLHIKPARVDGASKLYTERQYALICRQLQSHIAAMADLYIR